MSPPPQPSHSPGDPSFGDLKISCKDNECSRGSLSRPGVSSLVSDWTRQNRGCGSPPPPAPASASSVELTLVLAPKSSSKFLSWAQGPVGKKLHFQFLSWKMCSWLGMKSWGPGTESPTEGDLAEDLEGCSDFSGPPAVLGSCVLGGRVSGTHLQRGGMGESLRHTVHHSVYFHLPHLHGCPQIQKHPILWEAKSGMVMTSSPSSHHDLQTSQLKTELLELIRMGRSEHRAGVWGCVCGGTYPGGDVWLAMSPSRVDTMRGGIGAGIPTHCHMSLPGSVPRACTPEGPWKMINPPSTYSRALWELLLWVQL